MTHETKHRQFQLKIKADKGQDGSFSGYLAMFGNKDSYDDIIAKGAFAKDLQANGTKRTLLWQHDSYMPIGSFSATEDDTGLKIEGQINLGVQSGKEAYNLLKNGDISGLSIGYKAIKSERDGKQDATILKEIKLYEGSIVTFPANELATVTEVKSIDECKKLKDFERILRNKGFSKSDSTAFVSKIKKVVGEMSAEDSRCETGDSELSKAVQLITKHMGKQHDGNVSN